MFTLSKEGEQNCSHYRWFCKNLPNSPEFLQSPLIQPNFYFLITNMSDIPPEIITLVLVRLPVKSLLRFRCVCKPWRAFIDGQDFIKLHLHHSVESSSNQTLVVKASEPFFVDLDSFKRLDTGNIPSKPRYVIGSCNGLVLFQSESDLVLWNPSTRKQNKLPSTPLPQQLGKLPEYSFSHGRCALGYDSEHDDYKVARTVQYFGVVQNSIMRFCTETKIYSLKSNSWKMIEVPDDFPYVWFLEDETTCVYLNDNLHTVVKKYKSSSPGALILKFDLIKEKYSELPKPGCSGVGRDLSSVDVIGGCLAAVVFGGMKCSSEVWVMKEYGLEGSWFKLLCFDHSDPITPWLNLRPLAYSKSGNEVLLHDNGLYFNWYDLRKKIIKVARIEGLNESLSGMTHDPFNAWLCIGSLVSPYTPGGGVGV